MKLNIKNKITLFLFFFITVMVLGQIRPPVLILKGGNGYSTNFDTQNKISSQLIKTGSEGQATVEFWVMKGRSGELPSLVSGNGSWRYSNLSTGVSEFTISGVNNQISIKIGNVEKSVTLSDDKHFWSNNWNHVAFTIDKYTSRTTVYINGIESLNLNSILKESEPDLMYIQVTNDDQLSIAEYRAWNRLRTQSQIKKERFLTYSNENQTNLSELNGLGLVIAYVNNDFSSVPIKGLPLKETYWYNMVSDYTNNSSPSNSRIISSLIRGDNNLSLAQLRTDTDHPIYSLKDVLLTASDGEGINSAGNNIISLHWPHINKATNYIISRRNLRNNGALFSIINTYKPTSQNAVSSYLKYEDTDVLPNELYEYKVIAEGIVDSKPGKDNGFVFANGVITGLIETATRVSTEEVALEVVPTEGNLLPGKAIKFTEGSSPIKINDVSLFKDKSGSGTIEFWYRTPNIGGETNVILELGESEIALNHRHIAVYNKNQLNGRREFYLRTEKPNDNKWHHYAFSFSQLGSNLYIDGGIKQPKNKENPIIANGTSTKPFLIALDKNPKFMFNTEVKNNYELDEIRIWGKNKTVKEINKYWNYILGSNTSPDLLAYYRLDMGDEYNIYNQALTSLGQFKGTSITRITTVEQPTQKVIEGDNTVYKPLKYVSYTDTKGFYRFNSINTGNQEVNVANNFLSYKIIPSKANNQFSPTSKVRNIARTLNPREPIHADFTNISSYGISGNVVYRVPNEESSDFTKYPTVNNTDVLLDGKIITSTEPNSLVRTNTQGVFRIEGSPGRHTVTIGQPRLESSSIEIDRVSLDFKNEINGYAESNYKIKETSNKGFTWSGFIKPDVITPNSGYNSEIVIPAIQTILNWGKITLELRENNELILLSDKEILLRKTIEELSSYTFFAITKDPITNTIGLLVDDHYQTSSYSSENIDSKIYIGARHLNLDDFTNFSKANIDILEYRDNYYNKSNLLDIRKGSIIDKDRDFLKLSYNFEHNIGKKAIDLVTKLGEENNYLSLKEGAYFNNASSSRYIRKYKFDYAAFEEGDSADLVDPLNIQQYLFNLIEPISNINFENKTRRSFVGNIIIPCNNNVGDWVGIIKRTDIDFPLYERKITAEDFNIEKNIFTIKNLLPGQYSVELTRKENNDKIQSSIIDLRDGNKSYDFSYRNELQAKLDLYIISKKELEELPTNEELERRRIDPTCGVNSDIYKLESGKSILALVSVFEEYNGSICPVEGAEINIRGDMFIAPTNGISEATGKKAFLTFTGNPNFIGNYLRNLSIIVSDKNRNTTLNSSSYITGSRRGNEDFTLTDPTIGFTLYDPPGDASSSTLSRGSTYAFNKSFTSGSNVAMETSIKTGSDVETQSVILSVVAPLGIGVSTGIIQTAIESESSYVGSFQTDFNYSNTEQNGTSISLNKSISTSSDPIIVGADADVFIGISRVLTFGTGKKLTVNNNCKPIIETDKTVMTAKNLSPFVYTRQDIEDRIIRNLQQLLITKHDQLFTPANDAVNNRSSLDYQATIDKFGIDTSLPGTDKELTNYIYQIKRWKEIIKRKSREEQLTYFNNNTQTFDSTTSNISSIGSSLGNTVSKLDTQISFSGATSTTYSLSRESNTSIDKSGGSVLGGGTILESEFNIAGITFGLSTDISISATIEGSNSTSNINQREDSFTLSDSNIGDQFNVRIARDNIYDTPIFYTVSGQSMCPFESGTVPREGVEIIIDSAVKYGLGDEGILYNLTLRNTQIANDATQKIYIVAMNAASNNNGAQVFLNESPIFEPSTSSPINFKIDPSNQLTGVTNEVKAQLKITRGLDAPEDISYENIGIRIYSSCEQEGNGYRQYRVDEYKEVGVVPFQEIFVTAHFKGACISDIEPSMPDVNWVVNGNDNNKLDFRFRIPEITKNEISVGDDFSVDLEYAIEGNNAPHILNKLSLTELKNNLQEDGFIKYSADVSALTDGVYNFRVTPVCDDGGANLTESRQNPTAYKKGRISRVAPIIINTNPINGGVLTEGQITAEFNKEINPLSAINSSFSLRGILGGIPQDLISADFSEIGDEVIIPHQPIFNLDDTFSLEMWVNPSSLPNGKNVSIIEKGGNYGIKLSPEGKILVNNNIISSRKLQTSTWTHVSAVYDGVSTITIYFNGVPVGSGIISSLETNEEPIEIAKSEGGKSFIGKLDEVRIWNLDRSPNEIVSKLDKQLIGNEVGLLAYFVFDGNPLEGVDGAPDEAIRDYTGNAFSTTQVGLSFVRGIENAAPLDLSKIAKNLDYTIITSDDNTKIHILPVFDTSFIEGSQLTAMINSKKLEDPAGNKLEGKSWSFLVNRNTVNWSQNNITVSQKKGESTLITNVNLDNSRGGVPITYRFNNLPSWLTVNKREKGVAIKINEGVDNYLDATFIERNLEFTVSPHLESGLYSTNVSVEIFQNEANKSIPLGIESFNLKVEVNCITPNFEKDFNPNLYMGNMNILGKLMFKDTQSLDTGDIVIAYLNGEYRGHKAIGSNGLINLSVFGNYYESGNLSFNVWDSSECTEYKGILETYTHEFRSIIGTIQEPVTFTVGEKFVRRIPLVNGYQEISFNVKNNNNSNLISLESIKGLSTGDRILNTNTFEEIAVVNDDGTYTTTDNIQSLDTRQAYLIHITSGIDKVIEVEGVPMQLDVDISIKGDGLINIIPYLPNKIRNVSVALNSLTSTTIREGDRISRRGLNAIYTDKKGWIGSLTHLIPNFGYLYRAANDGILNYGDMSKFNFKEEENDTSYLDKAKSIRWDVNRNLYPNFMYFTASLETYDLNLNRDYVIAAFIDNEVRGIAKPKLIEGEYIYFIGVGGYNGEKITFKLYDGKSILNLDNIVNFDNSTLKGNLNIPYELNYSSKNNELTTGSIEKRGYQLNQNIPNPMLNTTRITYSIPNNDFVDISLYSLLGQKIYTFVSDKITGNKIHTIFWNNDILLKPGVYFYKLTSGNKILTRKIIIK